MGLAIVFLVLYFLPTIIALSRGKKNPGSTIIVNLFFGWTLIGWVISLSMAFGEKK